MRGHITVTKRESDDPGECQFVFFLRDIRERANRGQAK